MARGGEEEEEPAPARAKIKREPQDEAPAHRSKRLPRGFTRPEDHYIWQVSFINSVVPSPWVRCFGGLGTGFVGVRPGTASSEGSRKSGGAARATSSAAAPEGETCTATEPVVPLDATIVIFVNAPALGLQTRGGRTLDGYKDALDRSRNSLEWSAQRSDKDSKRVQAIIAHREHGGRVVVGVRSPVKRNFRLLGEVSSIDLLHKASFVVAPGDHVIQERGTRTYHKHITANCLNHGLRSGVALTAARYPVKDPKAKWCAACCYAAPKATLHFAELNEEGADAFQTRAEWECKRERISKEVKLEAEPEPITPAKRLRCKTSPDEVIVKTEKIEQEVSGDTVVKRELPEEAIEEARANGLLVVKAEMPEDPPESMSPEGAAEDTFGASWR